MAEEGEPFSVLRKILPFLSVVVVIAALYTAWIFYSRRSADRDVQQAREAKELEDARRTVRLLGGGQFKILAFYAYPGVIGRGEETRICYGVSGAKMVRIEPGVEAIKPSLNRCLNVAPRKTTQYRLIAEDGAGHTVTESFTLRVQ